MAAITQKMTRRSRTAVHQVNPGRNGLEQEEAKKRDDLFAALVSGFTIVVLLTAFLGWY